MSEKTRLEQFLMGIGLLTLLGVAAIAALVAYLWWDSKTATADVPDPG